VTRRDRSRTDLLDAVLAHHTGLERLVVDLEVLADQAAASLDGQGPGEPGAELPAAAARAVRTAASRLVMAASRHEAAEERMVWPLVRDAVGRGWELVEAGVDQEQRAKRLLVALERETTGTGRRRPTLPRPLIAEVAEAVRAHIRFEEGTVLPQLAPRLDAEQRDWMGRLYLDTHERGPTRPHPAMPPVPGLLGLTGPYVGRLDRVRDLLTWRGR